MVLAGILETPTENKDGSLLSEVEIVDLQRKKTLHSFFVLFCVELGAVGIALFIKEDLRRFKYNKDT